MSAKLLNINALSHKTELMTKLFKHRIFGQPEAADAFTNVLDKFFSGFYDRKRPITSMLFLGPTGTGKTASVEAFVEGLFGDSNRMIKIDCGEYQHSHDIAKLVGSPPGYLGHRETHPLLHNAKLISLRSEAFPFTVILFDEIEKASDALWNLLLGILDKGSLTTGTNEQVDELRNCVIIMTSNVGSKEMALKVGDGALGFTPPDLEDMPLTDLKKVSTDAARRKFMPEFLNRLDEIIVFNTLTPEDIKNILTAEVNKLRARIVGTSKIIVHIDLSPAAAKTILEEGYSKKENARFLKRTIEKRIVLPISRVVASEQVLNDDTIVIDYQGGDFKYYATFV